MPITYQVEPFKMVSDELAKLLPDHYSEIAESKDDILLDPDYDQYHALAAARQLTIITVRDGEDLVGYFVIIVRPHIHYRHSLTGTTDIYYLKPELRGGEAGYNMFVFAIEEMKKCGVERFYIAYKVKKPYKKLFEKLGFTEIEHHFSIYLGKQDE